MINYLGCSAACDEDPGAETLSQVIYEKVRPPLQISHPAHPALQQVMKTCLIFQLG